MLKRLWSDQRNACLLTLALLVIGVVISPWVLIAAVLPVGWVVLEAKPARDQPLTITEEDLKAQKPLLETKGNINDLQNRINKELSLLSQDDQAVISVQLYSVFSLEQTPLSKEDMKSCKVSSTSRAA